MAGNQDYPFEPLPELVSLSGWHKAFTKSRRKAGLNVAVSFNDALMGGEADAPLTFTLGVLRADLVVIAREENGCTAIANTVAGRAPETVEGRIKNQRATKATAKAGAKIKGGLSLRGPSAEVSGEAGAEGSITSEQKVETTRVFRAFAVDVPREIAKYGETSWSIKAGSHDADGLLLVTPEQKVMRGAPWDAQTDQRLVVKDVRASPSPDYHPEVEIKVRCQMQDLHAFGFAPVPGTPGESVISAVIEAIGLGKAKANKLAAAKAYIAQKLGARGMRGNPENDATEVTLAAVLAQPIKGQ